MLRFGQAMAVLTVCAVSAGIIYASVTPAQTCAIAKHKAAAKKTTAKLKCWQNAIRLGAASADPTCLTTAETKFNAAIGKAEATAGCVATWEPDLIEDVVDTCVGNIIALTLPCSGSGLRFGGSCWYLGDASSVGGSCDSICAGVGLTCNETATRDVAGSGGTLANCGMIIDALAPASAPNAQGESDLSACGSAELGVGCGYDPGFPPFSSPQAVRVTAPTTTCAATGFGGPCTNTSSRACACQ